MMTLLRSLLLLVLSTTAASAQITLPFPSFTTPTILRAEVEANDAELASLALNRTGGTMTGPLAGTTLTLSSTLTVSGAATLNSTLAVVGTSTLAVTSVGNLTLTGTTLPNVTNTRDLGSTSFRFDDIFTRAVDASVSMTTPTLTVSTTLNLTGSLSDSSGNVTIGDALDVTGLITASAGVTVTGTVTATTFSGSGASLTSIPETAITDGTTLARLAANETITGNWTFAGTSTNTSVAINTDGLVNAFRWGHSNTAYLNTVGALDGSGVPFLCFWCYHGPTANTLRRSSGTIQPVALLVDTAGAFVFTNGTASTVDTDFTAVTLWTMEGDGDLVPGTSLSDIGSSTRLVDVWGATVLALDTGSTSNPQVRFSASDDDGLFNNTTDLYVGKELASSTQNAYIRLTEDASTPSINFYAGSATAQGYISENEWQVGSNVLLAEQSSTPANPFSGAQIRIYMKGDLLILQFNDAGTVRYKYLDMTGTGVTWVHTTTAP